MGGSVVNIGGQIDYPGITARDNDFAGRQPLVIGNQPRQAGLRFRLVCAGNAHGGNQAAQGGLRCGMVFALDVVVSLRDIEQAG